ncbi:aminotransferase class V-fold PLP-dependent enzyme [Acinetobacter sp. HY1485]|uniref:aminotransferase class V-fold PLP-dependent enzyme n=1 Tax=Acinetobacter sp. HY1485 TaxID=2970918 RepID=UPI002FD01D9A
MKPLIYLDYAAATPVYPEVSKKMMECLSIDGFFGNPASSSHHYGVDAQTLVQQARQDVADLIGATANEIIWTSGATESDNLAIKGVAELAQSGHIITSAIEHKAVLDTCAKLEKKGFSVTYLQPQTDTGLILPEMVEQAIRADTILVSLMMVNNEIGTVTDVKKIGEMTYQKGIKFHVDAAQAAGKLPIDVRAMHIDLLSLSGHKVYGPKGIGVLYVNSNLHVEAQMHGGGHENGMRSGTLATHQIVGMGEAFKIAKEKLNSEQSRLKELRDYLFNSLNEMTTIQLNGDLDQSVANYLNVSFTGDDALGIINAIKHVVAISSSSACNSKLKKPSHVLVGLGREAVFANQSIRFSFGGYTTKAQLDTLLNYIKKHLELKKRFVTFV